MSGALLQGITMALFLGLGAAFPRQPQPLLGRHTVVNLATGAWMFLLRVTLVAWVAARTSVGLVDLGGVEHPLLQLLVSFLLLDLSRYWVHRLDHRVPWLWTFHRVHHSTERLDATAGLRMHVVDFLQLSAIPLVLFSVLLDTSSFAPWVLPAALGIGVVADGFQHANLRLDYGHPFWRAWDRVLNNPHFHAWHHNAEGHVRDGNYGNTLTIWDRLFGSDVTGPLPPPVLGLSADQQLDESVLGLQLLRPPRDAAVASLAEG
ncbi:MAG: fatty acid hydroxylase family protein [Deltaproteobacteria bacterium]|nr:MAG: fatty acid hydroxylase family protein [Deltaproteobacteria bacterium]